MRITPLSLLLLSLVAVTPARAELHITRDHGGYVEEYKSKYKRVRDKGERVIKAFTFGIKVTSSDGTSDLMSYYPDTVKDWIRRNGGLTTEMKKIKNGVDLWKIVDPCPDEW
jgi:hypothetical protein